MYGYTAEERIGKSFTDLLPPSGNYITESLRNVRIVQGGGSVDLYESERVHKSGKIINTISTYSHILENKGQVMGICTITKDVTKKKELEDQLAQKAAQLSEQNKDLETLNKNLKELNQDLVVKNEETNSFAYAASHDLKSPLRVITNFSELLYQQTKETLDPDNLKMIKTIQDHAFQMGRFINDLSAYL